MNKGEKYYVASVPELGITTQGTTKEEARRNLREAIQTHLEAMADYAMEHGEVAKTKDSWSPQSDGLSRLPAISRNDLVKILTKGVGFRVPRQREPRHFDQRFFIYHGPSASRARQGDVEAGLNDAKVSRKDFLEYA